MMELRVKTLDENFRDWEAHAFGFGYGTGEEHILPALKTFFAKIGSHPGLSHGYDHHVLSEALGSTVAWLLINVLCREDILEYGTSPRFGWLTREGEALKAYVDGKTAQQLFDICCADSEEGVIGCYPHSCNCGPRGYVEGRKCPNPFWPDSRRRGGAE